MWAFVIFCGREEVVGGKREGVVRERDRRRCLVVAMAEGRGGGPRERGCWCWDEVEEVVVGGERIGVRKVEEGMGKEEVWRAWVRAGRVVGVVGVDILRFLLDRIVRG